MMFDRNGYYPGQDFGQPMGGYMPMMDRRPQQQGGPDWIMAPTIKDVEHVSVAPGGKAWVMVQNEPVFAMRTANQMGLITTEYYRFEAYNPEAASVPAPAQDYVTRKEFDTLCQSVQEIMSATKPAPSRAKKEENA